MSLAIGAVIVGLVLLIWSADRFVDGASATARHAGMPTLLIGMLVIGFGTSAPEMVVSALASLDGNPGLALGNAYGSNITNIALILGLTAVISPIAVHSSVLRRELPVLTVITLVSGYQLLDGQVDTGDAVVLLAAFFGLMGWSVYQGMRGKGDPLGGEVETELDSQPMPLGKALFWLVLGLVLLVVSSRLLVWGAVTIAESLGVSDLIIGLTVVAVGTSLPELASSLAAIRKNEHDLALGNVLGSNLFNTLAVVGIAGTISTVTTEPAVLYRDWTVMAALTVVLFLFGYGFRGAGTGRINRLEGGVLLAAYLGYTGYLISTLVTAPGAAA
ncbi:calcium/sodium antiporter [Alcanivorax marinus]|uniref:Calcium/sodium antiporter n=1 Tax=Alloalcanivorax marinus TaxID=1177169 RepID=A0A9Q3US08_9GAMM|nr:calcium/sodium antiporter [Alloalcanivorax marinus]MCC4309988.1 calcium/sodium antiporter [Alloalcanivorax marinus]MCU5787964.1 CaCA family Na+/Ca+ antiporter [Alloalcanivorax marinus]